MEMKRNRITLPALQYKPIKSKERNKADIIRQKYSMTFPKRPNSSRTKGKKISFVRFMKTEVKLQLEF